MKSHNSAAYGRAIVKTTLIAVFYHVYQSSGWWDLFREQYSRLLDSGLGWRAELVHVGINGQEKVHIPLSNFRIEQNPNPDREEADTLRSLLSFAETHPESKILYMHTKGVTRNTPQVRDWRLLMEYFCVERWNECVSFLEQYDAVGCNLHDGGDSGYFPHFSGNFWWANANYVCSLDRSYLERPERLYREFWVGSGQGRLGELHNSKVDHYHQLYPPENYRGALV